MKHIARLVLLAAALLGAKPLHAQSEDGPIRLRVDVDRSVLPADCTGRAVVNIRLDCPRPPESERRPPVNLALVIDRSGSMAGEKIAKAREAALEIVRRLAPDDIMSLVAFDTQVETLVPAQRVGAARARLEAAICNIEPGGYTALYGGVARGAQEVRRFIEEPNFVSRIILVSDGIANVGPSSAEDLGRLGASLVREGISVTTVGLGLDFNEDLMTRLAQRSDGNTYFAQYSSDLPRIFSAELGDLLSVVARRVVISIEFPDGVRPIRFIGRDGTIRGQRAELRLNQLYGGQEKFALIEVEMAPARDGEEREIARARMNCEDALNQRALTLSAVRRVQFSSSNDAVIRSADKKVQADYAANTIAMAKDEAVALVDAGRRDEAAAAIRQKAAELKSMGATYGNPAVAAYATGAAPEADRIARGGLDNVTRKAYRAESSQVKNQQATDSDPHGP
jgi:Ca-activated chloride channel family protein